LVWMSFYRSRRVATQTYKIVLIMFLELKKARILLFVLLASLSFTAISETSIETVKDLRVLQRQSEAENLPVLLLMTAEDCGFCVAIRKHYLKPMIDSGEYASKILFRQLYIEDFSYLRNLQGDLVTGDSIALKYDVEVTPTILFINSNMQELGERIVGINSIDYFDKLLKTHISLARTHMLNKSKH